MSSSASTRGRAADQQGRSRSESESEEKPAEICHFVIVPVVLSDAERRTLQGWTTRRKTALGLALRGRIVLVPPEHHGPRHADSGGQRAHTRLR